MPDVEPPRRVLAYLQARADAFPASMLELGLLRGAWRSGIVQAAAESRTAADLAARCGLEPARGRALVDALVAFEVLDRTGDRYVVSDRWRPLLLDSPPFGVPATLDLMAASSQMVEAAATGGPTYWSGDDDARLAFAVGVAPDPESRHSLELIDFLSHQDPPLRRQLEAGGRYLELGCGTAGAMCTQLQLYPQVSAVGVELDERLVEVARARAERLGLTDRLRLVCADVRDFADPEPFDVAFWSQFFFPDESRAAALAVAFGSLRPGGTLSAPLLDEPVTDVDALRTTEGRSAAVDALLFRGWGIPHRSGEELVAEVEAAGFADAQMHELGAFRIVRATRP